MNEQDQYTLDSAYELLRDAQDMQAEREHSREQARISRRLRATKNPDLRSSLKNTSPRPAKPSKITGYNRHKP